AFAYSDGLESATSSGAIADADGLRGWLDVCLDETIARAEGPAAFEAWQCVREDRWSRIAELDAELMALRPAASGRRSSRAMGQRLLAAWCALYPDPRLETLQQLAFPIAFAAVCATSEVDRAQTVEALAYTRLAATISAAMRLAPIGQRDAHALLARTLER